MANSAEKKEKKPDNHMTAFVYEVGVYDGVPMAKVKDDQWSYRKWCVIASLENLRKLSGYLYKHVEFLAETTGEDKVFFIDFCNKEKP